MTALRRYRHHLLLWLGGTLLLALVAYAAPTITSVEGSTFGGNTPFGGNVPAITSGSPQSSFTLVITGTFNPELISSVTWLNTVTGQTQTFQVEGGIFSTSSTTIMVSIPRVLYATPVSSPQVVQITVEEFDSVATFRFNPRAVSPPGTFLINPPLTNAGPALPAATRGSPYNAPYVTGGTGPYFLGTLPSMPANLTISTNSPQNVTGTCNVLGFFTFQPTITDAWGNTLSPPEGLNCVTNPTLTALAPNSAAVGSNNVLVNAAGNNFVVDNSVAGTPVPGSRVMWNNNIPLQTSVINSNQLQFLVPASLLLSPTSAAITVVQPNGLPSNPLAFFILAPPPPPLQITTPSVPPGVVGTPYGAGFSASGGSGNYSFSLAGGNLPGGLTLDSNGGLSGTPTTAGSFRFTVRVSDGSATAVRDFLLVIAPPPLSVTGTVSDVPVGTTINVKFGAAGGIPPYTFAVSGAIPPGTTFSAGTLAGTTNSQGTFLFAVAATDSAGTVATKSFTIRVTPPVLSITGSLGNGVVGTPYSGQLGAANGTPPYSFTATGLPPGVSLSAAGAASGTPTLDGTFSVVVRVTDASGATANRTFPVVIEVAPLTITTSALAPGTVGVGYSASVAAAGGVPPYAFVVSGLPDGLTATGANIGGTPTTPGSSSVVARVTDSKGVSASRTLTLLVEAPPLVISTASLPSGAVGAAYSASVAAQGGVPPYTFTASGLPANLSMAANGSISGSPTAPGTFTVSVGARDSLGTSASRSLSLTVALPATPPITFPGLPETANPGTQTKVSVTLGAPYPVAVNVTMTLTFAPDTGADDPTVQFSTGGRTTQVVIPAGATAGPDVGIQTGTVAGVITITTRLTAATQDITPTPVPVRLIRISATPPVIQSVTATRNANGFNVVITGFASSRELTQGVFTFTAAAGTNLQTTTLTVPLDAIFVQYYGSAASAPFGSQFTLTVPFTVQGGTTGIVSVGVTLASRAGTSNAATANLQ